MRMIFFIAPFVMATAFGTSAYSQESSAPWGTAVAQVTGYLPQKVVYDVSVDTPEAMAAILDRMSILNVEYGADPYDAAIIAVLQGPEMQFFDTRNFEQYEALVRRAQSLTAGGVIEIKMCQRAARTIGLEPEHIHGFIELVPIGDAEIVRLQHEEDYAYIR